MKLKGNTTTRFKLNEKRIDNFKTIQKSKKDIYAKARHIIKEKQARKTFRPKKKKHNRH